jgi:hypothetical protein
LLCTELFVPCQHLRSNKRDGDNDELVTNGTLAGLVPRLCQCEVVQDAGITIDVPAFRLHERPKEISHTVGSQLVSADLHTILGATGSLKQIGHAGTPLLVPVSPATD